jgi:hypothetical protein
MTAKDGKPCVRCGGTAWNEKRDCINCKLERTRGWRQNNKDRVREYKRQYIKNHREQENRRIKKWRESNLDRARESARRWRRDNLDKHNEKNREWRQRYPDRAKEAIRRWRENNPDRERELSRQWRINNRERGKETARQWRKNNPEKAMAIVHRRLAKKRGNGGSFTAAEWTALCKQYNNYCLACGRKDVKLTADHVLPLSLGGTSNIDNIQPLCQSCNSSKNNRHIDYRTKPNISRWVQMCLLEQL